ncbi:MAG: hypothetical protein SGBAC_010525, partial [Bacillariaceae sp.]
MSSGNPPAGLPVTPARDAPPNSTEDATPSRLEELRVKVRESRKKVAVQKNRVLNSSLDSLDGNSSSSSLPSVETKPLHIQQQKEWKDAVKNIEQDKEALQKELAQIKQALQAKSSGNTDLDQARMWEERFQSLEAVNKALKEQCERDEMTKDELTRLCESLEQKLDTKVANSDDRSADSSLSQISRDLRQAQARESILHLELESLQTNNAKLISSANETQAILEKELQDSRLQHQQLSANMRELTIVEESTPMTQVGGSDMTLNDQVQELKQIIDAWKQESTADATDRKRFADLGDFVLRNLQGKVKTLQKVVTTQMAFRRKLESRVNQLLKQVQALRKQRSGDKLDQDGIKRLSMQLVDSTTGHAALEAQVAVLQQDLDHAHAEKEALAKNANEQEASLQQALEQNDSLLKQVALLESKISSLRSPDDSTTSLDSANEMELLMELQSVRDQMDQVTEESKNLQKLLNDEMSRNLDLTQEVEALKKKVDLLEVSGASQESRRVAKDEAPIAVLKKMKVLQEQTDQLIDQAILNKGGREEVATNQNELDAVSLLTELNDIRDKVHSHIEILERAQSDAAKSQASPLRTRQRKPGEMDIRIINEVTGRQTDLFVMAAQGLTMYDGVYNSKAVRSSNVRRWPPKIAQASKQKLVEVQSVLLDSQGNGIKVFSVKDLMQCVTKDFHSLVADPFGKIKLILRCRNVKDDEESKKLKSIRISNEVTGRIKDIIVPIAANVNVHDSIYNHAIIRTANIRKWPNHVYKQVAQKTHSIHCAITSEGKERKSFSVEELTTVSTNQLVNFADTPLDVIQMVLKCKEEISFVPPKDGDEEPAKTKELQSVQRHKAYVRSRVKNVATGRSQDLVILESDTLSLFDELYENEALRLGLIRRWPDRMAEMVKAGVAEIKCALVDTNGTMMRSFSIEELKSVKTNQLVGFVSERQDVYNFLLWCEQKDGTTTASSGSRFKPTGFRQRNWTPKDTSASQLHIRITNQESKRSKDLLVPVSLDANMHDAVYSHKSVLQANIRKWSQSVKVAVKQNTSEIKVALMNGNQEIRSFNVGELKATSVEHFADLVPKKNSLVHLVLSCQQTTAGYIRTLNEQVEELAKQKVSLEGILRTTKVEREAAAEKAEQLRREHKQSVSAITTELAATVAREALAQMTFDETKTELQTALDDEKKEAETTKAKVAKLESELMLVKTDKSAPIIHETPELEAQITALEEEKEKLAKLLENSPLKEELKELKSKLDDASLNENNLKEDLEMYKRRLHRELIGATANESSVKAELKSLKRAHQGELERAKQAESELRNEIVSYKDKLQQERYMLSCLSTELYDCLYREAELREEVDNMDSDANHKTIHTDETAVLIKA